MTNLLAWVIGLIFVLMSILGFMNTELVGRTGYFVTNTTHDLVHLISGLVLIAVAFWSSQKLPITFIILGSGYFLMALLGFIAGDQGHILGLIAVNNHDNWLHLILAVLFFLIGFKGKNKEVGYGPTRMQM